MARETIEVRLFWQDALIAVESFALTPRLRIEVGGEGGAFSVPEALCPEPICLADGPEIRDRVALGPLTFLTARHRRETRPPRFGWEGGLAAPLCLAFTLQVAMLAAGGSSPSTDLLALDGETPRLFSLPTPPSGPGPARAAFVAAPDPGGATRPGERPELRSRRATSRGSASPVARPASGGHGSTTRSDLSTVLAQAFSTLGSSRTGFSEGSAHGFGGFDDGLGGGAAAAAALRNASAPGRPGIPCGVVAPCTNAVAGGFFAMVRGRMPDAPEGLDEGVRDCAHGGRCSTVPRIRCGGLCGGESVGTLSREVIRRTIRQHMNQVRHCYERELISNPSLEGRVSVQFVIDPTGTVRSAIGTSENMSDVSSCVASAVRRWTFPASEGPTAVTYPFVFSLGE